MSDEYYYWLALLAERDGGALKVAIMGAVLVLAWLGMNTIWAQLVADWMGDKRQPARVLHAIRIGMLVGGVWLFVTTILLAWRTL